MFNFVHQIALLQIPYVCFKYDLHTHVLLSPCLSSNHRTWNTRPVIYPYNRCTFVRRKETMDSASIYFSVNRSRAILFNWSTCME